MTFELNLSPEQLRQRRAIELAQDAVALANQFNDNLVSQYQSMYENYWKIGRDDISIEQLQDRSDVMQTAELNILLNAGVYVQAMLGIGLPLPEKYHTLPYTFTVVDVAFQDGHTESLVSSFLELFGLMQQHGQFTTGRLVLGELVEFWQTQNEEQNEPTNDD